MADLASLFGVPAGQTIGGYFLGAGNRLGAQARSANELLNPVEAIHDAMDAGGRAMNPNLPVEQRWMDAGTALALSLGVAAPAGLGRLAGRPGAEAIAEALTGFSGSVGDAGRALQDFAAGESGAFHVDNPGGEWLSDKLEDALHRRQRASPNTYSSNLGGSTTTGYFDRILDLPVDMMEDVRGAMGEEAYRMSGQKLKDLQQSIAENGYRPSPILVHVRNDGVPFIVDGNHRVAEAMLSGRPSIPAEVRYVLGGEGAGGQFAPHNISWFERPGADPVATRGAEILDLLTSGRASEVTDEMLDMGDPVANANLNKYLWDHYDLPMDEASRMARAREMGAVDKAYYHETPNDFASFKLNAMPESHTGGGAIWLSDTADRIPAAHNTRVDGEFATGVNTMAVLPLGGDRVPYDFIYPLKQSGEVNINFPSIVTPSEAQKIVDAGYTHATQGIERVEFNPRNIRSRFARLDPRLAHLRNLNAGVGGLTVGLPMSYYLMNERDAPPA